MYAKTFFRSSLSIFERSGLISVSPSGRIPSFGGAGGADFPPGAALGAEQPMADAATRIRGSNARMGLSFARRLLQFGHPARVRLPSVRSGRDFVGHSVGTECVGQGVGSKPVEELEGRVRRRHQALLLERGGSAREF